MDVEGRILASEERITAIETRMNSIEIDLVETVKCQRNNTVNLGLLIEETKDLVKLQRSIQTTISVGTAAQKFGMYIIKWPVIFTGFYAIIEYFKAR